ncbi:MAG TPA: hypothetical protein VJZ72_06575 [Candidatus Limnocylindrales bacterium]|nr:hypothetical protein [Candidatus Limnocylindrales bacterium]
MDTEPVFHARWDPELEAEPADEGMRRLTDPTDSLIPDSGTETGFSGGVVRIVSGLKTAIETSTAAIPA